MPDQSLHLIQQWMEMVITTRGDLKQKLETAAGAFHLDIHDVVAFKKGLSAQRRLDVYASGYVLRLLECLKSDFPGLLAFMGEPVFEVFAKAYIVSLPPQSWSLFYLGQRFPQFLRDTKPEGSLPDDLLDLPAEIAALERLKIEVLYVKGTEENPTSTSFTPAGPLDYLFDSTLFQAAPCLRLIQLKFPLMDFLNRLEQGETPPIPDKKTTYVAATRKDFRLRMLELEHWQYAFLLACTDPVSVQQGAATAVDDSGIDVKTILARLFVWLPVAVESGCLVRL